MASVTLVFPKMVADAVGCTELRLSAGTLREALEEGFRKLPALKFHLLAEDGDLRPHVLCFVNDTLFREIASVRISLEDGDEISFVQAVSGGSAV